MIVWLASYPRSGNTLLRTVLKQTMGLWSYSGPMPITEPWELFYEKASADETTCLVKTHLQPRDSQPGDWLTERHRGLTLLEAHLCLDGSLYICNIWHYWKGGAESSPEKCQPVNGPTDIF